MTAIEKGKTSIGEFVLERVISVIDKIMSILNSHVGRDKSSRIL